MLTVNGRVRLCRVRWHSAEEGSQTLTDCLLDEAERAISEGVREMACRLNRGSTSFAMTAANLARAAHLTVSKETLRKLIEEEGKEFVVLWSPETAEHEPDYRELGRFPSREKALEFLSADG